VGWRDRDWARLDEGERRDLYQSGEVAARRSRGRASTGLLVAVAVSAAIYMVGHFPRAHPIVPALAFHLPRLGSTHSHMATAAAAFGSTFTISGTTRKDGVVTVEGSWNGAPWQPLGSSVARGGAYSVSFPVRDHGTLKVRTKYPGGEADGTILVP
jgi:hypothetical protein